MRISVDCVSADIGGLGARRNCSIGDTEQGLGQHGGDVRQSGE